MDSKVVSRFVSGTVSIGIGTFINALLGLIGFMILTRHISQEELGAYVLVIVISTFLSQVSNLGLDLALPNRISMEDNQDSIRRLANTALVFRFILTVLVGLLALSIESLLTQVFGGTSVQGLGVFIAILYFLDSWNKLQKSILQGLFLFGRISMGSVASSSLNFLLIILLVLVFPLGLSGVIYAKVLSSLLADLFLFFSTPLSKRVEFHLSELKSMIRFGMPLQINDILSFAFGRVDTVLIATLLGPSAIAYYEVARKIPDNLGTFYESFRAVYYPMISSFFGKGENVKTANMLNISTRLVSVVTSALALMALVFGREIILVLFSDKYLPSVPAFVLLMIALSISLIGYTLGTSLVAIGETNKPPIINVVHFVTGLTGNLLLVPSLGIAGAALASGLGSVATNPLNVFFLRRKGVNAEVASYLKPILAFSSIAIIYVAITPQGLISRMSSIAIFFLLCWLMSCIKKEELILLYAEIRSLIRKYLGKPSPRTIRS